jgi:hypothetical protein
MNADELTAEIAEDGGRRRQKDGESGGYSSYSGLSGCPSASTGMMRLPLYRMALRESPSSVTGDNDGDGALRELSADLFIQLVDVRSFAPSDDDESRIGNHSDLRTLAAALIKVRWPFLGRSITITPKRGDFGGILNSARNPPPSNISPELRSSSAAAWKTLPDPARSCPI